MTQQNPVQIRDRITELVRVRASDLIQNPKNWRKHPKAQADALRSVLQDVGFADALLARQTPDGLVLIDGHLRAETADPSAELPVLILDVSEEEADKLLLTLDPLSAMAAVDQEKLGQLLGAVVVGQEDLEKMLGAMAGATDSDSTGTRRTRVPQAVLQYQLIFENEARQDRFFSFLRWLKVKYPNAETIDERVDLAIAGLMVEPVESPATTDPAPEERPRQPRREPAS